MNTTSLLLIFLGGGTGSAIRYILSKAINYFIPTSFPFALLCVNVIACFLSGAFAGYLLSKAEYHNFRLLLIVGFCGGFSTFSGFSDQTLRLFQQGNFSYAFLDIGLHLILCVVATYVGITLFKN